jgi:hypothetical protein
MLPEEAHVVKWPVGTINTLSEDEVSDLLSTLLP